MVADEQGESAQPKSSPNPPPKRFSNATWTVLIVIAAGAVSANVYIGVKTGVFQTTAMKVERVEADMRTVAIALETYYVDNCAYPLTINLRDLSPSVSSRTKDRDKTNLWDQPTVNLGWKEPDGPFGLTSPIRYLSPVPHDPFSPGGSYPFAFWKDAHMWVLYSPGPDRRFDIVPGDLVFASSPSSFTLQLIPLIYDPSNGARSAGDIVRVKQ